MAGSLPLSGQIDPKAFPFLVMDLHHQAATGSFKVDGPSYQKALYFRAGRILFGSSNDPRDQLGAILIESGRLTPEQLEDVNTKVGPGSPLAKVLAETGFVSQRELSEAARGKVERILSDILSYPAGNFEFEDGVLPKGAVDLKLSTERLVIAAVRRISDRNFVLRHLDSLEVVLSPTERMASHVGEIETEAGGLPAQLDGQRTLKDAAARTRLDEFDAAKIACGLMFLGLVQRAEAPLFLAGDDAGPEISPFDQTIRMDANPLTEAVPAFMPEAAPEAESPFFSPAPEAEAGADFQISDPASFAPPPEAPAPFTLQEPEPPPPEPALDATIVQGTPAFDMEDEPTVPVPEPLMPAAEPESTPTVVTSTRTRPDARALDEATMGAQVAPTVRPSKDDLAAVDALLNAPSRPEPLAASKGPRAPVVAPMPRNKRAGTPSRKPLLIAMGIPAALVLAGGAWFLLDGRKPAPAPTPKPVPATTVAAAPTTLAAPPTTGAPAATTPAVTVAQAPPTTTKAPPTTVARATPPPATTLAARPPATSPPAVTADPTALLRSGQIPDAARASASRLSEAPRGSATVQVLVACSTETIQKAVQATGGAQLLVVPVNLKGKACYRLCWGLFPTSAAASAGAKDLPAYFHQEGVKPRVVSATEVLP